MFQRKIIIIGILALGIFVSGQVLAHTPLCSCYDNANGTVTCEGGFSDGSSAAGVKMRVQDKNSKVLIKGKMDQDSEFTFDKPSGPYTVVFDAGEGHVLEIDGKGIVE
jgi:type 1 fimbria pilin